MLAPSPPALPEAQLGLALRTALAAQRRRLATMVRGRVLDLGGLGTSMAYGPAVEEVVVLGPVAPTAGCRPLPASPPGCPPLPVSPGPASAHQVPVRLVASLDEAEPMAPFDSVVSILHLAALTDPLDRLRRLGGLLGSDGRLLLFEPLRRPGWRGRVADGLRLAGPPGRLRRPGRGSPAGLRPIAHPLPALVRRAGLVPTSMERITMPSPLPPMRWCVRLVAVPSPAGREAPAGPS